LKYIGDRSVSEIQASDFAGNMAWLRCLHDSNKSTRGIWLSQELHQQMIRQKQSYVAQIVGYRCFSSVLSNLPEAAHHETTQFFPFHFFRWMLVFNPVHLFQFT